MMAASRATSSSDRRVSSRATSASGPFARVVTRAQPARPGRPRPCGDPPGAGGHGEVAARPAAAIQGGGAGGGPGGDPGGGGGGGPRGGERSSAGWGGGGGGGTTAPPP